MAEDDENPYIGVWRLRYWYPSNNHDGDDVSEYYAQAYQRKHELVLESIPNKINSYMFVRLSVGDGLATGYWEETTSPTGKFGGTIYSAALQLIIGKDLRLMEGRWAGVGHDPELKKARIYTGKWHMERVARIPDEALPPV